MKKFLTLLFISTLLSFQTVSSEGQSQQPKPPQPQPRGPGQAQSFSGMAMGSMEDTFARQEATLEDEYYLGRAVAANILSSYKPYTANQALTTYLNRICQTLVVNSPQPVIYSGYYVMILDSPEFNAFASPGGHIFVTKGLVEAAASEDMLAALIAHELSHIMLKHGMRLIDDMAIFGQASQVASMGQAMSGNAAANRLMLYRNSVSSVLDAMIKNGYSQEYEFEADRIAVRILAAAGYDPAAMTEILKVLQRVQTSQKGGFNNTHPTPAARITNVDTVLKNIRVQDTKSFRTPRFKNK